MLCPLEKSTVLWKLRGRHARVQLEVYNDISCAVWPLRNDIIFRERSTHFHDQPFRRRSLHPPRRRSARPGWTTLLINRRLQQTWVLLMIESKHWLKIARTSSGWNKSTNDWRFSVQVDHLHFGHSRLSGGVSGVANGAWSMLKADSSRGSSAFFRSLGCQPYLYSAPVVT